MHILPLYESQRLFRELAEGKEKAFRQIFDVYKERIQYTAIKLLKMPAVAEEIAQDVLMQVWVNQCKFSAIEDPEAYLFTVTYHRIYRQLRQTARENKLLRELLEMLSAEQFSMEDTLHAQESKAIIEEAIESLPEQQKRAFKLSRDEGMTHEQIARKLNISPNTVKNHIVLALRHIRSHMGQTAIVIMTVLWNNIPHS